MIFAQKLDPQDIVYNELREVVESASRANKKVWLEDFTGINWTYCPNASFAIDSLIQDFPDVLNTVEWHNPSYTPDSIDYCYVACGEISGDMNDCTTEGYIYSQRGNMYDVGGIPHMQWNGIFGVVGAGAPWIARYEEYYPCLLYTSDAADED